MSVNDQTRLVGDRILPYPDVVTAREAVRSFSRPKTERDEVVDVYKRLLVSSTEITQNVAKTLLEGFENLILDAQRVTFDLLFHIFRQSTDISRLIVPLAVLVGSREEQVQTKALELICSVGPLAKPTEDLAMGCLRNSNPAIRMAGARILFTIGTACSRSITRQLRAVAQRYVSEREFCALLLATVRRITGQPLPGASESLPVGEMSGEDTSESGRSNVTEVLARLLQGRTMLVIEDDEVIRNSVQELLSDKLGMTVLTACNGQEGLATAIRRLQGGDALDFVVLDLKMPDMNGVQVLKKLRETPETADLSVVVVSAVADERILSALSSMGIVEYIRKPFRMNQLIRALVAAYRSKINA